MSSESSPSTTSEQLLAELLEEISTRYASGEEVDLAAYEQRYPDHAERLRELLPTLAALRELEEQEGSESESLFSNALETTHPQQLGDFRIIRQIGRGGMGVVYEARQLSLDRRVALKVLPFAAMLDQKRLSRFQIEAQAAASLHHPHIVPVYSVGCDRGCHYYAMHFIDGQSLAELLQSLRASTLADNSFSVSQLFSRGPESEQAAASLSSTTVVNDGEAADQDAAAAEPTQVAVTSSTTGHTFAELSGTNSRAYYEAVARLGIQAADGLEHAHSRGIIHRDIKPANLLVDETAQLWITDFGLAQIEQGPQLTMTGDLLGTWRYMSPEQAQPRGAPTDHRTDIYSLGVTLYELLTLQPAFAGDDRASLVQRIVHEEPVPPRRIDRRIPVDLETIVRKAIDKDVTARYPSARELGDDLRRFLSHEPIRAKPPSYANRCVKWLRRHPGVVWSSAIMVALIALASTIGTALLVQEQHHTQQALQLAQDNFQQSENHRLQAEQAVQMSEQSLYVQGLNLAGRAWWDGDAARATSIMEANPAYAARPDLRGFAWQYLQAVVWPLSDMLLQCTAEVTSTAFSPCGRWLAAADESGTIYVWSTDNLDTPRTLLGHDGTVHQVVFAPSGDILMSCGEDGTVRIWDPQRGLETDRITDAHDGSAVTCLELSTDGGHWVSGAYDGTLAIWDAETKTRMGIISAHATAIRAVAWSPSRAIVASASNDRLVRLWDARQQKLLHTWQGHRGMVLSVAFSPDGRYVISGSNDRTIRVWDTQRGVSVAVQRDPRDGVEAVRMLSDGRTLLSADRGGDVRYWTVQGRRVVNSYTLEDDDDVVLASDLLLDGREWAALTSDRRLLVHDILTGRTHVVTTDIPLVNYTMIKRGLRYARNGTLLYCGDRVFVRQEHASTLDSPWQLQSTLDVPYGYCADFSPDGSVLVLGQDDRLALFDPLTGRRTTDAASGCERVVDLQYAPDGQQLAVLGNKGEVTFWDTATLTTLQTVAPPLRSGHELRYSPDGRWITVCSGEGELVICEVATGEMREVELPGDSVRSACWLGDSETLVVSLAGPPARFYHIDHGFARQPVLPRGDHWNVCASRFGAELLFSSFRDQRIVDPQQWDIRANPRRSFHGQADWLLDCAVSPDETRLLSGGRNGAVRLWRMRHNRWDWLVDRHTTEDEVADMHVSADGNHIALARVWQITAHAWPSGAKLTETTQVFSLDAANPTAGRVSSLAVDYVGKQVVSGHMDGGVRIWQFGNPVPLHTFSAFSPGSGSVNSVVISPDRQLVAVASRRVDRWKLYRRINWQLLVDLPTTDCDELVFSPDSKYLFYADGQDAVAWSIAEERVTRRYSQHALRIHQLAVSPDGQQLATVGEDRQLIVWDVVTGAVRAAVPAHADSIVAVAFSRDGQTIATGSRDGTIKLWHVPTGHELYLVDHLPSAIERLAFMREDHALIAKTADGFVTVYDAGTPHPQ